MAAQWIHEHFGVPAMLALLATWGLAFAVCLWAAGKIVPKIRWPRMRSRHRRDLAIVLVWTIATFVLEMSFFHACEVFEARARAAWLADQAQVQPW